MAKITEQDLQVVRELESAFRSATGESYMLNTEYPIRPVWQGIAIKAAAYRKVSNGTLYLKILKQSRLGPVFIHFAASSKTGLRQCGESILEARDPDVRAALIAEFEALFDPNPKAAI